MGTLQKFWGSVGSTAVAALATVFAPINAVQAQDAAPEAPPCGIVEAAGYTDVHVRSCATPGYEEPRTLDDILADEDLSRMVVLHFGPGMKDTDLVAFDLTQNANTPAVAIPGGLVNGVQVIIAGWTRGRLVFDQYRQDGGDVGSIAEEGYRRRMAALRAASAESTTTGASLVRTSGRAPNGME